MSIPSFVAVLQTFSQSNPVCKLPTESLSAVAEKNPDTYTAENPGFIQKEWLSQFCDTDKPVALKLLKKLNYYSIDRTRQAFQKIYTELKKQGVTTENTMFSFFGKAKSGSVMGYFFRQANCIPDEAFLDYSELKALKHLSHDKKNLVIVDDVLHSGDQVIEFLKDVSKNTDQLKNVSIYICSLVASPEGINFVKKESQKLGYPNIKFMCDDFCRKIEDPLNLKFSLTDKQKINSLMKNIIHKFPEKLEERYFSNINTYLVAFAHNTPAFTLPIISYNYPGVWKALLPRYRAQKTEVRKNTRQARLSALECVKADIKN